MTDADRHPDLAGAVAAHPEDFDAARAVIAEAEAADGASPVSDQAMLAAAQGQRALLLFRRRDERHDGDAPAHDPTAPDAVGIVGQGEVDLVVRPGLRGRGIGTAALGALLAHGRAGGARTDPGPLRAWAHGENPAAEALLGAAGFAPVRTLFRMDLDPALLPDGEADPLSLAAPDGLRLRAFDPRRPGDAPAWVDANAAAFASHPEQGRITESDFALMRAEPWFDADDLILLEEVGSDPAAPRLAGSTWVKTVREAGEDGAQETVVAELYAVGVRPERAGQGLGRLLLDATLRRMARHSPDRVSLYVDGENERAVELYRRAEFTVGSRSRQWERPPAPAAGARIDA
ncbi:mycothiol synthase [Leucobacter zeae]|nr:mycothiol synthase [Leucobacter zeae]